jgi:photosystem II stability/assembly factor-like uncharacterized protein
MGKDYSICVGAVGFGGGVWHSPDGGDNWNRIRDPFPLGSQVRGIAVYPDNPNRILAGSEHGVYRSEDCGATWEKMWSPMEGMPIWSIAIDPQNTNNIFVGIKPAALFRSQDGGQSWSKLSVQMAQECHIGPPMVTMLMVDPQDSRTVWAGVEVDGVYRSLDGGDTWTHITTGVHPDIHGMAISPGEENKVLFSTPREIYYTTDGGESWESLNSTENLPLPYSRGIAFKADDPDVLFSALGESAISSQGALRRSTDGGRTWENRPLPVEPNSNIWGFATHPADPDFILASSLFGELYSSEDAGDSWNKLKREFTEVGAMTWVPN